MCIMEGRRKNIRKNTHIHCFCLKTIKWLSMLMLMLEPGLALGQRAITQKIAQKTAPGPSFSKPPQLSSQMGACTVELKIEGAIGAAALSAFAQAEKSVRQNKCASLLLLINTPGGQLITTRKIIKRILNAEFPVLCLVHPAGGRAGSAGAIILQACHINGAIETSNIGAATPIMAMGQKMSSDLRKKLINDTRSWMDSLTELRKRNRRFGREIVTKAKALSAREAKKIKAIDWTGKTKQDFLQFAKGRTVKVKDGKTQLVQTGAVIPVQLGWRHQIISLITEPELVYLLFTSSLFLIFYEITHPGLAAPGVLGVMGLIVSFIGMHKLAFSWGGLLLIILSIALFLLEAFTAGFGILGTGGVVSFVLGSFLLFDPSKTGGVDISAGTIMSVSVFFALLMGAVAWLAWSAVKIKKTQSLSDDLLNELAELTSVDKPGLSGTLFINGESWRWQSTTVIKKGDNIKIIGYKGLVLKIEPAGFNPEAANKNT